MLKKIDTRSIKNKNKLVKKKCVTDINFSAPRKQSVIVVYWN